MKVSRLICLIISFIILFVLLMFSILYPDNSFLFFFLMLLTLLPIKILKRKERREKIKMIMDYSATGNAEKFINDITVFNNKCIITRSNRFIDEVNIGLVLISAGEFQKAEELMIKLSKIQDKVNDISIIFYYRFCCDYFFYTNKSNELKIIIEKFEYIIKNASPKIQAQYSSIFLLSEAKKNILEEKNLDSVRQMYSAMPIAQTPVNMLSRDYILSIIAIKQKRYDEAISKLKMLSEKKYNLFFVNNAKKLLNDLQNVN